MTVLLSNNANSKLGGSISATDTTLSVTTGDGVKFPILAAGQWFPVVAIKASGQREIMRCTGRSGDLLTVTRGQEGTAAQAFSAGDRVELRITNAAMAEFLQNGDSRLGSAAARAVGSANGQLPENGGAASFAGLTATGLNVNGLGYVKRTGSYMGDWSSAVAVIDGNPDPCIAFHASGRAVAKLLGMTTDNELCWGGNGGANNKIWHAGNFNPATKQDVIGFTPVQQGGGASMTASKVYIGWRTDSTLGLRVDGTEFGVSWPINISGRATYATNVDGASVQNTVAGLAIDALGSFITAVPTIGGVGPGVAVAGSNLRYSGSGGNSGTAPSGTWICVGNGSGTGGYKRIA